MTSNKHPKIFKSLSLSNLKLFLQHPNHSIWNNTQISNLSLSFQVWSFFHNTQNTQSATQNLMSLSLFSLSLCLCLFFLFFFFPFCFFFFFSAVTSCVSSSTVLMNPKKKKERKEKGLCFFSFFWVFYFLKNKIWLVCWTLPKTKLGMNFGDVIIFYFASPNCLSLNLFYKKYYYYFYFFWGVRNSLLQGKP